MLSISASSNSASLFYIYNEYAQLRSEQFFPQKASTFSRYIEMVKKTQWVYLAHGFSLQSFRKQISYYSKKRPEPKEQASAQTITAVEGKESDKKEL